MLGNSPFYNKLLRKYVTAFGTLFNDIWVVRTTEANVETSRALVPIIYASKEKYFVRLNEDPTLNKADQITLPIMTFEIVSLSYADDRKQTSTLKLFNKAETGASTQYMSVPYDIGFELNIYARNTDDANQIVEQILPFFSKDLTLTYDLVTGMNIKKDIPIVLDSVNQQINYEGNYDSVRYVYWTMTFTMRADFYGPKSVPQLIRKVITNIFQDPALVAGYITRMNMVSGNSGTYPIDSIVFTGNSYTDAKAYGLVTAWNANTGKLTLGAVQGQFSANDVVQSLSSNASYTLHSFDTTPLKLVEIDIVPNPLTANVSDNYGYTTTITEYPDTI